MHYSLLWLHSVFKQISSLSNLGMFLNKKMAEGNLTTWQHERHFNKYTPAKKKQQKIRSCTCVLEVLILTSLNLTCYDSVVVCAFSFNTSV